MLINRDIYWSVIRKLLVTLTVAFIFLVHPVFSQQGNTYEVPLKVKKGSYVYMKDSLWFFTYDTILYLANSLIPDDPEVVQRTVMFYDSLKEKASRTGFTKKLYDIAIVLPPEESNQDNRTVINEDYSRYEGNTIRKISVKRLDPFGTNINNPDVESAKGFSDFLNKSHATTREFIVRNYLLFKEGDSFKSFTTTESERLLRRLKFIDDAKIIVIPVGEDIVDIHIITRDVYSLGFYYDVRGTKSGTIEIFERSLLGLGHDLIISFPYDFYKDYYGFGYRFSYNIKNISRSLIDASLTYSNALGREYYDLNISRDFITATTKYAGGFNIREAFTANDLDTLETRVPVEYNKLDVWFGRSFLIDPFNMTRFVISARHINNNVYERPDISRDSYYSLQKYKLYLGSIALVNQRYYKTNLIYNFGRTEDIPYGLKLQITVGKELNEFSNRDYFGIEGSAARKPASNGYLFVGGNFGLFTREDIIEQGAIDLRLKYISNLTTMGKYRLRHFVDIKYTRGFQRFEDEYLRVDDVDHIRGFSNDTIRPDQRLILNLESVAFSPAYLYGFRFVFFGFTDIGVLTHEKRFNLKNDLISEIGMGLRIRNENFIFKTIQLRISFFPFSPPYSELRHLNALGEKLLSPPDFDPTSPSIIRYR